MSLKTNAALYKRAVDYMRAWGWSKYIEFVSGWETRTNSSTIVTPTQVTVHHTGGARTPTSYLLHAPDRPKLKNLANIHVDTVARKAKILAAGGASHAGYTHEPCFQRIQGGTAPLDRDLVPGRDSATFSPNKRAVGIEVNGAGGANEWDEWTYRITVALAAAFDLAGGWTKQGESPRVGAHKEHTTRKPGDPAASMGKFRRDVLDCLAHPWGPTAAQPPVETEFGSRALSKDGNDRGADVAELGRRLIALGYDIGTPSDLFGPRMDAAVRDLQVKHGLQVDGVVGAETFAVLLGPENPVEPQPEEPADPEPPAPSGAAFRFGLCAFQAQRFNGLKDTSPKRGEFLRSKMACSLYVLTEVTETARDAIRKALGTAWRVFPEAYVTVLWDSGKWVHQARAAAGFGTGVHAAVRAQLVHVASGAPLDVIGLHVRPRASFGATATDAAVAKGKAGDVAKAASLIRRGVPTILAGDFNGADTSTIKNAGLVRATPLTDTYDAPGIQALDQVWVTPDLIIRGTTLVDPGDITDHKTWVCKSTLPNSTL